MGKENSLWTLREWEKIRSRTDDQQQNPPSSFLFLIKTRLLQKKTLINVYYNTHHTLSRITQTHRLLRLHISVTRASFALLSLLTLNQSIYALLAPERNPHLYARVFEAKFDLGVMRRRGFGVAGGDWE